MSRIHETRQINFFITIFPFFLRLLGMGHCDLPALVFRVLALLTVFFFFLFFPLKLHRILHAIQCCGIYSRSHVPGLVPVIVSSVFVVKSDIFDHLPHSALMSYTKLRFSPMTWRKLEPEFLTYLLCIQV